MQLNITFKGHNITLPIATGETVQGLIYRAISSDAEFSARIHGEGKRFGGRSFKLFTFGELKGKYTVRDKSIIYFSDVSLEIRSADAYFIQLLFSYFTLNRIVRLGNNAVEISDLRLSETSVYSECALIRTVSPITVYLTEHSGYTCYFSPEDGEFYSLVSSNAKRKWASVYGDNADVEIRLSAAEETGYIKRATRFKDTYITAWHGSFVLEASPCVIGFLYNTGLGSKSSQGFGMFDIIS